MTHGTNLAEQDSGRGRMVVTVPSYIQQPAERIPRPVRISIVVATLRGSVNPNRTYVISGHYDSRVTDVMDSVFTPGANDDASGVAVSLELARLQYGDLPQFVDFDYVARVAKVNVAWMWSISQAPGMPQDVVIGVSELTNRRRFGGPTAAT